MPDQMHEEKIPKVGTLLAFVMLYGRLLPVNFTGLFHWQIGNHTIARMQAKQPWKVWVILNHILNHTVAVPIVNREKTWNQNRVYIWWGTLHAHRTYFFSCSIIAVPPSFLYHAHNTRDDDAHTKDCCRNGQHHECDSLEILNRKIWNGIS